MMETPTIELAGGDRIPAIGLGTWKSAPGEVGAAVGEAIRIGYRHVDCAPLYGNEPEVGEALHRAITSGATTRDELWITSKLWNSCHRPGDVLPALKQTLTDLRLDELDLFLIHWPVTLRPGVDLPETADDFVAPGEAPLGETWTAMEQAVDAGLCRHIGVSNFNPKKMKAIAAQARIAPAVNQVECHPIFPQRELLAACRELGVVLTAYAPLGSPDRPDRLRHESDPSVLAEPVVGSVAARHSATPAQILLAWALHRGTCVIPKSVNPQRLRENLESARLRLDDEDMAAIDTLDRGHRLIDGSIWTPEGSPYTLSWLWDE